MRKSWTESDDSRLDRDYGRVPTRELAAAMGRTAKSVRSRAKSRGVLAREPLGHAVTFAIRVLYGVLDARRIAEVVGLPLQKVYSYHARHGFGHGKKASHGEEFDAYVRGKNALGWSDTEIAGAYGAAIGRVVDRHTVTRRREKLGLPSALHSEHQRAKVRANTAEQLRKAGLSSIGHLRGAAYRRFARDNGWPEDLQVREVQILNLMWARGPMTKRQLVEALGLPWKGSRKSLLGNRAGGSYLATLMRRGLVVSLGRVVRHKDCGTGVGQGRNTVLYSLSPTIQRRKVESNDCEQRQPAGLQAPAGPGQTAGGRRDGAVAAVAGCDARHDRRATRRGSA